MSGKPVYIRLSDSHLAYMKAVDLLMHLKALGIVSVVEDDRFTVIGRWGTNKRTLRSKLA